MQIDILLTYLLTYLLINRIIVSSDIWSDLVIYPAISRYHFWQILLVVIFTRAVCVYPDILCIIRCIQSESAIMQETRRTSRLLSTKQPWPQHISLQNLRPRVYHKKAQDVNDLRRHLFDAWVGALSWSVTERYWRWHSSVAQTSPCLHTNYRTVLIFTVV